MEQMNEAYEELKRVEHLIYVSLKYTRTVDVILNILTRMTDAYALMVDALIIYEKEQGKVSVEPESIIERAQLIKQIFANDDVVVDNMELYLLLRKLLRAKNVERENEYRRYVTMKTIIDGREEIVTIDIITNYCLYQREFFSHVRAIVEGKSTIEVATQETTQPQAPAWMREGELRDDEDVEDLKQELRSPKSQSAPPPTKQPLKVRPVTAPPRKRAPRPKKYKIQIPKGKNAIMTPEYIPIIRAALEVEKQKKLAAAQKVADAKAARSAKAKTNAAAKSKAKKTVAKAKSKVATKPKKSKQKPAARPKAKPAKKKR